MKKTISSNVMINNALTGLGMYDKANRGANVKEILAKLGTLDKIKLEGSNLKIDITLGHEAEPEIHSLLQEVINAHQTSVQETKTGLGHKFLIVDLLKTR